MRPPRPGTHAYARGRGGYADGRSSACLMRVMREAERPNRKCGVQGAEAQDAAGPAHLSGTRRRHGRRVQSSVIAPRNALFVTSVRERSAPRRSAH
jgi:hypothetical protein